MNAHLVQEDYRYSRECVESDVSGIDETSH